jgi:ubiquinone/menaquinone biosynthesis C-methylase UbiE
MRQICPPFLWTALSKCRKKLILDKSASVSANSFKVEDNNTQDLDMYWDPEFAKILDEWGKDNVWNEIQMLLACGSGKVLDIACGNGRTITILDKYPNISVHGFDISDLLISKAIEKGISSERLRVTDATKTDYADKEFDYSYSIGSLEHFTIEGIDAFISESARYTKNASFHMIPISRTGEDIGWIKTKQSYFNNSEKWWLAKFQKHFNKVYPVPSKWEDQLSFGRWFICTK